MDLERTADAAADLALADDVRDGKQILHGLTLLIRYGRLGSIRDTLKPEHLAVLAGDPQLIANFRELADPRAADLVLPGAARHGVALAGLALLSDDQIDTAVDQVLDTARRLLAGDQAARRVFDDEWKLLRPRGWSLPPGTAAKLLNDLPQLLTTTNYSIKFALLDLPNLEMWAALGLLAPDHPVTTAIVLAILETLERGPLSWIETRPSLDLLANLHTLGVLSDAHTDLVADALDAAVRRGGDVDDLFPVLAVLARLKAERAARHGDILLRAGASNENSTSMPSWCVVAGSCYQYLPPPARDAIRTVVHRYADSFSRGADEFIRSARAAADAVARIAADDATTADGLRRIGALGELDRGAYAAVHLLRAEASEIATMERRLLQSTKQKQKGMRRSVAYDVWIWVVEGEAWRPSSELTERLLALAWSDDSDERNPAIAALANLARTKRLARPHLERTQEALIAAASDRGSWSVRAQAAFMLTDVCEDGVRGAIDGLLKQLSLDLVADVRRAAAASLRKLAVMEGERGPASGGPQGP